MVHKPATSRCESDVTTSTRVERVVFDPRRCFFFFKGLTIERKGRDQKLAALQQSCSKFISSVSGFNIVAHPPFLFFHFCSRDKAAVEQRHHPGCVCLALHRLLVRHAPHWLGRVRLRAPEDLLHSGLQQGRQVGKRTNHPTNLPLSDFVAEAFALNVSPTQELRVVPDPHVHLQHGHPGLRRYVLLSIHCAEIQEDRKPQSKFL